MRGAPHVGFSTTIRKINSRTSFDVCRLPMGLLTLEISFQYKRNPALCQRTTVSGVTAMRDRCHPDQNRRMATRRACRAGLILAADADASARRVVDVARDSRVGGSDARARSEPAFRSTGNQRFGFGCRSIGTSWPGNAESTIKPGGSAYV